MWRNIFITPSAVISLLSRGVESCMSIFITITLLQMAGDSFVSEISIQAEISLLIFLLVLQCAIGVLSSWLDSRWSLDSINRFQSLAMKRLKDRTGLHREGTKQRRNSAGLSGASVETIDGMCQYTSEYFFMATTTLGTSIVFGLHFGATVLTGILVGLFFSFVLVFLNSRKVAELADRRTRSRWSLGEHMQSGWMAMTSADAITKKVWMRSLKRYFSIYSNIIQGQALYVTGVQSIIRCSCMISPIIPVAFVALNSVGSPSGIAALVALPRLIAVSNQFSQVVAMTVAIPEMHGRWRSLFRFLPTDKEGVEPASLESLMKNGSCEFSLVKEDGTTVPFFSPELPKTGRLRITGSNGSGKTTVLLKIKSEFGIDAALFTNETVAVLASRRQHGSSGENKIRALHRFLLGRQENIILLDEWESRLDDATRNHVDMLMDEMGKTKLIIEARHV